MKKRGSTEGSLLWQEWIRSCERRPAKVVVIDAVGAREWTSNQLTRDAVAWADHFHSYREGEKIAFQLPNGPEWMAVFLALQRARLTAIPFDAAMPEEGCLALAKAVGASALFREGKLHPLGGRRAATGCCCVKVTSGSEGIPKQVRCQAEHLLADGRQVAATMKIRASDRNLGVIPLGHSYGLGNLVMPLIQQGTAIVTAGEYVPRQLVEWSGRHQVTVLPLVPAVLRVLAALPAGSDFDSVRTVISAGAMLSPATAQEFHARYGLRIHNFYGSSETGGICYDRTGRASLEGRSVGRPLDGVKLTLKRGRIVVASPAVATRSGRWELGDLGEWNARGELVLLGRLGQEANIGGKKVHPGEIERTLRALPGIRDLAVWVLRESGRETMGAAVETDLSRSEVEAAIAAKLPAWKIPKHLFVARELPRTARGKLDAAALRQK